MAIQVNGTTVIDNSRNLTNITSIDATTAAAIGAAGVGAGTSVATSTSVSPTFNASSDNVFIHTGLNNTSSVTFSSLPTEKEWTYWFNAGADVNSFSQEGPLRDGVLEWNSVSSTLAGVKPSFLSYASFASGTSYFNTLAQGVSSGNANYAHVMNIDETGTKILFVWSAWNTAQGYARFNLSTPFDLSTISYVSRVTTPQYYSNITSYYTVPHIEQNGKGILYPGEGVVSGGSGNTYIHWTPFSTAWDPTTSQTGQVKIADPSYEVVYQVFWGNNGYYLYYVNGSSQVKRSTLTTPYDLSTAGGWTTYNLPYQLNYPQVSYNNSSPYFSKDGKKFMHHQYGRLSILELTTAWDLSSAVVASEVNIVYNGSNVYYGMSNGGVLFVRDSANGHRLLDFRSGFAPSFSQIPSAVVVGPAPNSWNKVDFMTNNGGTDIYASTVYSAVKG